MSNECSFNAIGSGDRLVDRVVSELQRSITSGRLPEGTRLPPQTELADELAVSRTVLREAMRVLATRGFLTSKPGVGTTVKQPAPSQLSDSLNSLLQSQGISLEHLHHVRSVLECEIAFLAASEANEEDIAVLRRALAEMTLSMGDADALADRDTEFHQALAAATHNPLLSLLLGSIRDVMQQLRLVVHHQRGLAEMVVRDHQEILQGVLIHDSQAARAAMLEHLQHAREMQEDLLRTQRRVQNPVEQNTTAGSGFASTSGTGLTEIGHGPASVANATGVDD